MTDIISKDHLNADSPEMQAWIGSVLTEDIGAGDITTESIVDGSLKARAHISAKEDGVLCGLDLIKQVFLKLDAECRFDDLGNRDGGRIASGGQIMEIAGSCRALLTGERTALNILQRLSGIATRTHEFVKAASPVTILDTRKTTPGLRQLEKYAVYCGGARNHRFGLYDAVLIKDNHIKIAGGVEEAVKRTREKLGRNFPIEVEAADFAEVAAALQAGADIILLDNMSDPEIEKAVEQIGGKAKIEVSGNITLERLRQLRTMKIDFVSVGELTHSVRAIDLSMNIDVSASVPHR